MSTRTFGTSVKRNIDSTLLTGKGTFIDDVPLTDALKDPDTEVLTF